MSKYPDHEIEGIIGHPRSDGMIAYRQMIAMEKIAESLAELEALLRQPPASEIVSLNSGELGPGLLADPATLAMQNSMQHSRRRRSSETT